MTTIHSSQGDPSKLSGLNSTATAWWQRAWFLVLASGVVMGAALGIRHVQGLFLLPVSLDHGWSRETFGFAMAIQNLTWGVMQPFTGMIADRFGSTKVVVVGLLFYAVGLYLMATVETPAHFILAAGVCIGIGLSGTTFGVIYGALTRLVAPDRRSWALGLAGAIGGFGQFAMVPAAQEMVGSLGWTEALFVLAIFIALVSPLAFSLRSQADSVEFTQPRQKLSGALNEAFRHRGFWLLNLGFLACGFQLAFVGTHLPTYLLDKGMAPASAVSALAIIALTNIFGTYYFGQMGGRFRKKYLLTGIYLIRTVTMALFLLLPLSPLSLYLFAGVMGFVWLGTAPLTNGLVSQIFGVQYITTLFGFVFFAHQLGSFLGVWMGSYLFELTKSYDLIWQYSMILGLIAAALHWPIDDRGVARMTPAKVSV